MASLTLAFSSSSSTSSSLFAKSSLPQKQNPLSLSLSKPNCSFLSPSIPPASLSLSGLPIFPQRPTFATQAIEKLTSAQKLELLKTLSPGGDDVDIKALVERVKKNQPKPAVMPEEIFAVVMIGSRQYIVIPGRWIYAPRLKGANVNDKIVLNKVLLVGKRNSTYVGKPVVTNAKVHAVVEEQLLDDKVIVFKYKAKKNYRRNIGHRQPITRIRITAITDYEDYPASTLDSQTVSPVA